MLLSTLIVVKPPVRGSCFALMASFLAAAAPATARATLVLVEEGVSRAPIVLFENAPPRTRQAADELADYLEKISGVRLDVVEGEPDPVPASAIWVGHQPAVEGLFPEIDFTFEHPEEILIAANDRHLVIAGRDRWDPERLSVSFSHAAATDRRQRIDGFQQEYGTINAVYTFLQDFLEVRWLWPGELGIDLVPRKTIAFEPFTFRYHPKIRYRAGVLRLSSLRGQHVQGHSQIWSRHQRMLLGSLEMEHSSHGFTGWWERFHETHPEFFALQPDGTRTWRNPRTVKMCQSNPAVWAQWIEDVEQELKNNPFETIFEAGPNDGWSMAHCICEHCRAWDHPDGEIRSFGWQGTRQDYVALSDRDVTFYNRLAALLRERFPDRELYVLGSAYGHTRPAPVEAVPADNVIISSIANFIMNPDAVDRGSTRGMTHRQQFIDWGAVTSRRVWRPNTGNPARWQAGFPKVCIRQTADDFRFVAESGVFGIIIDTVREHWASHGPMYYMMAQAAWNPWMNVDAVMDDYYRRAFGPAADAMQVYWSLMETVERTEDFDDAFLDRAQGFLDAARQAAADAPDIYLRRIDFVAQGLIYTRLQLDTAAQMARFRESGGTDTEAENRARENWLAIKRMTEETPWSINWEPIRPGAGSGRGGPFPEDLAGWR